MSRVSRGGARDRGPSSDETGRRPRGPGPATRERTDATPSLRSIGVLSVLFGFAAIPHPDSGWAGQLTRRSHREQRRVLSWRICEGRAAAPALSSADRVADRVGQSPAPIGARQCARHRERVSATLSTASGQGHARPSTRRRAEFSGHFRGPHQSVRVGVPISKARAVSRNLHGKGVGEHARPRVCTRGPGPAAAPRDTHVAPANGNVRRRRTAVERPTATVSSQRGRAQTSRSPCPTRRRACCPRGSWSTAITSSLQRRSVVNASIRPCHSRPTSARRGATIGSHG